MSTNNLDTRNQKKIRRRSSTPLNLFESKTPLKQVGKRKSLRLKQFEASTLTKQKIRKKSGKYTSLFLDEFEASAVPEQKTPRKIPEKRTSLVLDEFETFAEVNENTEKEIISIMENISIDKMAPMNNNNMDYGCTPMNRNRITVPNNNNINSKCLAPMKLSNAVIHTITEFIYKYRFISDNNLINAVIPTHTSSPAPRKRKNISTYSSFNNINLLAPVKIDAPLVDGPKPDVKKYKLIDAPRFDTRRKLVKRRRSKLPGKKQKIF